MNEYVRKRIEEMSIDFTSVQSVVDTEGEIVMAEKIYDTMSQIDYYKKNPEKLYYIDLKDDLIGRKIVVAELNGEKKPSDKTIVLIGHFDTVGISDYGPLKEYSTQPAELIERFRELKLPEEVREDLESGKYMFEIGRAHV